jgi:hypothetical protein
MTFETVGFVLAAVAAGTLGAACVVFLKQRWSKPTKPLYDIDAPVLNPEPTPTIFKAGIRLGPRAYVSNDGQSWITATVISVEGDTESYNDNQTVTYVIDGPTLPEENQELKTITEPVSVFLSKFMLVGTARHENSLL